MLIANNTKVKWSGLNTNDTGTLLAYIPADEDAMEVLGELNIPYTRSQIKFDVVSSDDRYLIEEELFDAFIFVAINVTDVTIDEHPISAKEPAKVVPLMDIGEQLEVSSGRRYTMFAKAGDIVFGFRMLSPTEFKIWASACLNPTWLRPSSRKDGAYTGFITVKKANEDVTYLTRLDKQNVLNQLASCLESLDFTVHPEVIAEQLDLMTVVDKPNQDGLYLDYSLHSSSH